VTPSPISAGVIGHGAHQARVPLQPFREIGGRPRPPAMADGEIGIVGEPGLEAASRRFCGFYAKTINRQRARVNGLVEAVTRDLLDELTARAGALIVFAVKPRTCREAASKSGIRDKAISPSASPAGVRLANLSNG